jgi:hypothetical protein
MPLSGEDAMKNLSKEKQQHLILTVLLTAMALAGIFLYLLKPQWNKWGTLKTQREAAQRRLAQVKQTIELADQIEAQLIESKKRLDKIEGGMATGDLYFWAINTLRQYKLAYKVEIPQFSQIDGPKPMPMLAQFPYQQATLTIGGSAQFYDLGRFLADFENRFPYMRIMNLTLEPASGLVSGEKERLAFKMEVGMLVKPGAS